MTFAVIKTGGKQYKVAANDVITVEKLPGEAGAATTTRGAAPSSMASWTGRPKASAGSLPRSSTAIPAWRCA